MRKVLCVCLNFIHAEIVMPASQSPKPILGYSPGPLSVGGAVTVEVIIPPVPLQPLMDAQYLDSKIMSQRPGMYIKYFPYLYSPVNGKLLGGGCYTFDTYEHAAEYARWTETYEVESEGQTIKFWDRPLFESHRKWVWRVVGAHSFREMEAQVCTRLIQWKYENDGVGQKLVELYPVLKETIKDLDVAVVWLLHNSEEKMVGLHVVFRNETGTVDGDLAQEALEEAIKAPLETLMPRDLSLKKFFDRSSFLLTMWLPISREAGGTELHIPLRSVAVPDISLDYI